MASIGRQPRSGEPGGSAPEGNHDGATNRGREVHRPRVIRQNYMAQLKQSLQFLEGSFPCEVRCARSDLCGDPGAHFYVAWTSQHDPFGFTMLGANRPGDLRKTLSWPALRRAVLRTGIEAKQRRHGQTGWKKGV